MHYSLHVYMFHDCMCGNTVLERLMGKGEVGGEREREKKKRKDREKEKERKCGTCILGS